MTTNTSNVAPKGRDGDRLFWTSRFGLLSRAAYVQKLREWADDWMAVADGSFYGMTRKNLDTGAVRQAERLREQAREIEAEGVRLGFLRPKKTPTHPLPKGLQG